MVHLVAHNLNLLHRVQQGKLTNTGTSKINNFQTSYYSTVLRIVFSILYTFLFTSTNFLDRDEIIKGMHNTTSIRDNFGSSLFKW